MIVIVKKVNDVTVKQSKEVFLGKHKPFFSVTEKRVKSHKKYSSKKKMGFEHSERVREGKKKLFYTEYLVKTCLLEPFFSVSWSH